MEINIDEIQIQIKFVEMRDLKAIIALDFGGKFTIRGFRIRVSKYENQKADGEKLWLTPPSYFGGNKWHPIFFIPDKELWQRLEEKILDEYEQQSEENFKKRLGLDGDDS